MITVIWDTWLKPGTEAEGLRLTRRVWSDMRSFDGYVSHQLFVDQDTPAHIIALGKWRSREDAEAVLQKYKHSKTVHRLTALLARPRDRWVTREDDHEAKALEKGQREKAEEFRQQGAKVYLGR
jgi:quinol monooxygenase YgiN